MLTSRKKLKTLFFKHCESITLAILEKKIIITTTMIIIIVAPDKMERDVKRRKEMKAGIKLWSHFW